MIDIKIQKSPSANYFINISKFLSSPGCVLFTESEIKDFVLLLQETLDNETACKVHGTGREPYKEEIKNFKVCRCKNSVVIPKGIFGYSDGISCAVCGGVPAREEPGETNLCYYCGKLSEHQEISCPERTQV